MDSLTLGKNKVFDCWTIGAKINIRNRRTVQPCCHQAVRDGSVRSGTKWKVKLTASVSAGGRGLTHQNMVLSKHDPGRHSQLSTMETLRNANCTKPNWAAQLRAAILTVASPGIAKNKQINKKNPNCFPINQHYKRDSCIRNWGFVSSTIL